MLTEEELPPAFVQYRAKVVSKVRPPVETVPVAAFVPDQFELAGVAEAVQEVGLLVADQVRAEAIPVGTEVGLAARVTVGTTGAVAVNPASTVLPRSIVAVQIGLEPPVQVELPPWALYQLAKVLPESGVAVKVTEVPEA